MHRNPDGSFRLYLEGQHWRFNLGKSYPSSIEPKEVIADYSRFIRRTFRRHEGIKTWRICSLVASEGLGSDLTTPTLREWACGFAIAAGLKFEMIRSTEKRKETYFAGNSEADVSRALKSHMLENNMFEE
jgi:hypothetical protein